MRFRATANYIDKLDTFVKFPLTKLSLSEYTTNASGTPSKGEYDLYGIINHYSFSGIGGHYATFVKSKSVKDFWVNCNDSRLECYNDKEVVTQNAYILFYKRRVMTSSNIINLGYQ